MSNSCDFATAKHINFAHKYEITADIGEDLANIFDCILAVQGYPVDKCPLENCQKRAILNKAIRNGQKSFFEKKVAQAYWKVSTRFQGKQEKRRKSNERRVVQSKIFQPLWNFYNDLGAEHANTIGGISANLFYKTHEWIRFRYLCLIAFNSRCLVCGVYAKFGAQIEIDHIKPRHLFPELAFRPDNVQALCKKCHQAKGLSSDSHVGNLHPLKDGGYHA